MNHKAVQCLFDLKLVVLAMRTGQYSFPQHVKLTDECKDLISRMLCVDVEKRITVADIQVRFATTTGNRLPCLWCGLIYVCMQAQLCCSFFPGARLPS